MKSDKEGRESRLCVHWGISPCMPSRLCSTSLLPPRNKQHTLYSAQFSRVLHLLPLFFPSLPSRDPIPGMLAKTSAVSLLESEADRACISFVVGGVIISCCYYCEVAQFHQTVGKLVQKNPAKDFLKTVSPWGAYCTRK